MVRVYSVFVTTVFVFQAMPHIAPDEEGKLRIWRTVARVASSPLSAAILAKWFRGRSGAWEGGEGRGLILDVGAVKEFGSSSEQGCLKGILPARDGHGIVAYYFCHVLIYSFIYLFYYFPGHVPRFPHLLCFVQSFLPSATPPLRVTPTRKHVGGMPVN